MAVSQEPSDVHCLKMMFIQTWKSRFRLLYKKMDHDIVWQNVAVQDLKEDKYLIVAQ